MNDEVTTGEEGYEMTRAATDEEPSKATCNTGEDAALAVVQNEYNHCFERSVKLDNKVRILLTVCAFLFVMLSEAVPHAGMALPYSYRTPFNTMGGTPFYRTIPHKILLLVLP